MLAALWLATAARAATSIEAPFGPETLEGVVDETVGSRSPAGLGAVWAEEGGTAATGPWNKNSKVETSIGIGLIQ